MTPGSIQEALEALTQRVDRLEAERLPRRVSDLEASLRKVEHQLELVFAQGQAASRALGEQRTILERVSSLLEQLVRQQTPTVVVAHGGVDGRTSR